MRSACGRQAVTALVALVMIASAAAPVAADALAPGTYTLRTIGRLKCGRYRGYWSIKACGLLDVVDLWCAVIWPALLSRASLRQHTFISCYH